MFAVVEHDERLARSEGLDQLIQSLAGGTRNALIHQRALAPAKRCEHRVRHLRRVEHRGKLDEPHTVTVGGYTRTGRLGGKTGLAGTSWSEHGDQSRGAECISH